MQKQLNLKYSASQSIDSGLYASMFAFASIFLMSKGMTNSSIGIILALCSVSSIIIQTFFANFTAKHHAIKLQNIMTGSLIVVILASTALLLIPSPLVLILAVIIAFSFTQSNTPFLNSLAFIFEEDGIHINYGNGRAFGSLAYAIFVLIIGYVVQGTNPNILPFFYIGFALSYILIVQSYRLKKEPLGEISSDMSIEEASNEIEKEAPNKVSIPVEQQSLAGFLKKYRQLVFIIFGFALVLFGQTIVSTYMIQIVSPIGGTSQTVGIAIFFAAASEFPGMMSFGQLIKKRPAEFWLKCSLLFFILKTVLLFFATNVTMVYISQCLQFGSYAIAYPAVVQIIKTTVDKFDLFKGQTLFTIGTTMSSVFASLLGGVIIDHFGISSMVLVSMIVSFLGGLIIYGTLDQVGDRVKQRLASKTTPIL